MSNFEKFAIYLSVNYNYSEVRGKWINRNLNPVVESNWIGIKEVTAKWQETVKAIEERIENVPQGITVKLTKG